MNLEPNPRKTKDFRDLGAVDITALREAVLAIPEEVWEAENGAKPNRFGALDQASHIIFRFVTNFDDWRSSANHRLWPEWGPRLEPVLAQAVADYRYARGGFPRIMLARLPAGGVILPHVDANPAAKWPHKIHVPLQTNERAMFFVNGVGRHIAEGEAVEVNNLGVHAVRNGGSTDRIHLIFEYYDMDQSPPSWAAAVA
ncbi:MAG: aspartyl/asparaginyl beta-hydroxylase domain-containing protein [Hyphomonadaceae bacterium]